MLFEVVKGSFNLRTHSEQEVLPACHELFVLFVMGWCNHQTAKAFPEPLSLHATTVVTVTDQDAGMFIGQPFFDLVVMFIGRRKHNRAQLV